MLWRVVQLSQEKVSSPAELRIGIFELKAVSSYCNLELTNSHCLMDDYILISGKDGNAYLCRVLQKFVEVSSHCGIGYKPRLFLR